MPLDGASKIQQRTPETAEEPSPVAIPRSREAPNGCGRRSAACSRQPTRLIARRL